MNTNSIQSDAINDTMERSKPNFFSCSAKSLLIAIICADMNIMGADRNVHITIDDAIWKNCMLPQ